MPLSIRPYVPRAIGQVEVCALLYRAIGQVEVCALLYRAIGQVEVCALLYMKNIDGVRTFWDTYILVGTNG